MALKRNKDMETQILTEEEYNKAVERIHVLEEEVIPQFDCGRKELKSLIEQISEYEEKHFSLPPPTAEDIKQFNKEQGIKEQA